MPTLVGRFARYVLAGAQPDRGGRALPRDGLARGGDVIMPNVIAVRHWERLLGGVLYAVSPRMDWATLPDDYVRNASRVP
jgi:hypothetical protein